MEILHSCALALSLSFFDQHLNGTLTLSQTKIWEGTRNSPRVRHKSTTTGYALSLPIFFRSHCSHARRRRRRWVDWANGFFTFSFHYPLMMMDSMIAAAGLAFGVETPTRKIQLFCTTGPARRWKIAYFGAWVLRVPFAR